MKETFEEKIRSAKLTYLMKLTLYHTVPPSNNPYLKGLEIFFGKRKNDGNKHFSQNVFYLSQNKFQFFCHIHLLQVL